MNTKADHTTTYFDQHVPEFGLSPLKYTVKQIARLKNENSSLLEIGCGRGNVLGYLRDTTGLAQVAGMDVSAECLKVAKKTLDCPLIHASVLDEGDMAKITQRFDFILLPAVLHHLIGKNRAESKANAEKAIMSAMKLLNPKGHLIIIEPTFFPSLAMDMVFYGKKMFSGLTSKRIEILNKWVNIGPPIVSYLTNPQLTAMIEKIPSAQIVDAHIEKTPFHPLMRLFLIQERSIATLTVQRKADFS